MDGLTLGILGLALSAILAGCGSAIGLKSTASASSGVLAEDPSKFSKVLVLTLLPATQGLYGFVIAIIGSSYLPAAGSAAFEGWQILAAALPMGITGMISAIYQGKASVSAILAVGKKPEIGGKSMLFPAMIEFYALLGMVVSILLLGTI